MVTTKCWNARKRRHKEDDVLMNLPANEANTTERRKGKEARGGEQTRRQTDKKMRKNAREKKYDL